MTKMFTFNYNTHEHTFLGFFDEGVKFTFFSNRKPDSVFYADFKSKVLAPGIKIVDDKMNELSSTDFIQIIEKLNKSTKRTSRLADFFGEFAGVRQIPA